MKLDLSQILNRAVLAGMFATALLSACGGEEPKKAAAPAAVAPPPPEVDVVTVKSGVVTLTRDLPGRLQAFRSAQVRARVEGIVEKRLFTEGSDVKAGDELYQIYVGNYRSNFEAARSALEVARQNLERSKQLLETKMVSQQNYDMAASSLKQAEAVYSKAKEDWDNTRVPAPISGHVGRSLVTEGALVGRGEPTLLTTIEQIDPLYVNFTQSGADVLRLKQALKAGKLKRSDSSSVELVLEDGTLYSLPGKLLFADMAADPGTGSVTLRAEIPNPKHELLPGMFVTIRIPEAEAEHAISLPQRAVQANVQGQFVMVIDAEGKAAPRPVKTGSMSGSDFIIESGLQGGEQVIVNGLQKARPGTVVKPVPLQSTASAAVSAVAAASSSEKK